MCIRDSTKLGKEIEIAVKAAGPDPSGNTRLRILMQNAKAENMPKENVERAIKRATEKDACLLYTSRVERRADRAFRNLLRRQLSRCGPCGDLAYGAGDLAARGVVERQYQRQGLASGGPLLGFGQITLHLSLIHI